MECHLSILDENFLLLVYSIHFSLQGSKEDKMDPATHTSLHIVKGALQLVFGGPLDDEGSSLIWTTRVFQQDNRGSITVELKEKPTTEQLVAVEEAVIKVIQEDRPIRIHQLSREEASEQYGDAWKDRFEIPDSVKTLQIVEIKNWNVNACISPHVNSTGEVESIRIRKTRYRPNKGVLEVSFSVGTI